MSYGFGCSRRNRFTSYRTFNVFCNDPDADVIARCQHKTRISALWIVIASEPLPIGLQVVLKKSDRHLLS
jgi:hypothetical protein